MTNEHPLGTALATAVPLHILELQERGGPTDYDMEQMNGVAQLLGERGDILLFGGKKKGECAEIFNKTAFGIAVLAFAPGGVTLFGQHFEATTEKTKRAVPKKAKKRTKKAKKRAKKTKKKRKA